jgi:uncharacterized protein YggT (Ycf19 family)
VIFFPYRLLTDFFRQLLGFLIAAVVIVFELLNRLNLFAKQSPVEPIPIQIEEIPEKPVNPLLEAIIDIIINTISVVVVVLLLFFSIRGAYRFIVTMYRRSKGTTNITENELVVDEVFSIRKKSRKSERKFDFGEGEAKEIRRKYYRFVRRAIRSGAKIKPSDSPEEIRSAVSGRIGKDFDALSLRYAKYRYGSGNRSINLAEKENY